MDEPDDVIEHQTLLMSPGPTMERSIANPLGLSVDEARSGPMKGLDKPLPLLYPGSMYICVLCICCEVWYICTCVPFNIYIHTYILYVYSHAHYIRTYLCIVRFLRFWSM